MGWIGWIGPITLHCSLALSTAFSASTSPLPVAVSGPTVADAPLLLVLQRPVVTSFAVLIRMERTCAGLRCGQACFTSAAAPASCGAAAEVPLKAAQPSLLAVSSPPLPPPAGPGKVPPALPTSI